MATRWKRFNRSTLNKTIAFSLFVLCILVGVNSGLNIFLNVENYESVTVEKYLESNSLSNELRYSASRLEYVLRNYKSEKYIKSGGTVKNIDVEDSWQLTNLYNNFITENNYEDGEETVKLFWIQKNDEIQAIKEIIKKSDLANYEQIIYDLNNPEGLKYYATDGVNICTNTDDPDKEFYNTRKAYVLIDDTGVEIYPENGDSSYSPSLLDRIKNIEGGSDETIIYIGITDEGLATRIEKWNNDRETLIKNIILITICFILAIMCFIFLLIAIGKKVEDEEIHYIFIDKIYSDINLLIITSIVTVSILQFDHIINIRHINVNLMKLAMLSTSLLVVTFFLALFLSIVKHLKDGNIIKYSFIFISLSKILEILIKIISSGPLMLKTMSTIVILMILTIISVKYPPSIFIVLLISAYVVYNKIKLFSKIQDGIRIAKEGDYENKIVLHGNGEFKSLADDINAITDGLKIAVQNGVKSERLKTELITNVSHDIKTPLTSIISYVDLLKREGLQSVNAPKYLDVLDRKSSRLKILTEDLFEAAKLTSGNIKVNFEKVNINALVSQILGELDEKIQESKLGFKVSATSEKILANADGRFLSRVMENLLSNIFKYALKGSRVYIDIVETNHEVAVCFKNVSANELNIPVEELMERFKRGDESRNSEGNGLGLAIAKSLMEVQNGELELSIDGDLFKAEIKMPLYKS
ncbi:signal transduction histidine kinase [Sedimentibacter acidaminivorans]|uniref:histidine kinase n=1 Tax=Sedimentibacter acidaminivorans TaxID=913099 RepID=A0ABS4G9J8_9FIRM|nr:sensor histidine kinase [Sedimentibacter acidaminivorans]MBP1924368.1 signal transduction histidine kinase [Sedimentibacter acidaminivorans]